MTLIQAMIRPFALVYGDISVSAPQGGIVLGGIASAMLLQQDRK